MGTKPKVLGFTEDGFWVLADSFGRAWTKDERCYNYIVAFDGETMTVIAEVVNGELREYDKGYPRPVHRGIGGGYVLPQEAP